MPILRHFSLWWECYVGNLFGDKVSGMKAFFVSMLGLCLFSGWYPVSE